MELNLPPKKQTLLDEILSDLKLVPNITAVTLGGSTARGMAKEDSDLDLGIYYKEDAPFDINVISKIAKKYSPNAVATDFYGWGQWVNGGAWISTSICKVDFIYRNIDQVRKVIDEAHKGTVRYDFDQQPPYGFRSVIYLGETACTIPLYDPDNEILKLKKSIEKYPPQLKKGIIESSLWGAEFALLFADEFALKKDIPNIAGCLTRAYHYLLHALYAINDTYFISDKGTNYVLNSFLLKPHDFYERIGTILGKINSDESLKVSINEMHGLWKETSMLYPNYKSMFQVALR